MKGKKAPVSGPGFLLGGLGLLLTAGSLFCGVSVSVVRVQGELMYALFPPAYLVIAAMFLFHIPALAYLVRAFRGAGRLSAGNWSILLIGALSAMAPVTEWAALHDIVDNIREGYSSRLETTVIYTGVLLHVVFISLLLRHLYDAGRRRAGEGGKQRIDDAVFRIVHGVGMLSGGLGLLFCAFQAFLRIPRYRPFLVVFYGAAILAPYAILESLWRRTLRKGTTGLDERQKDDIAAGSSRALRIVLAAGLTIFLAGAFSPEVSGRLPWFPAVFFAGLFTFSFSVFRRSLVSDADPD